MSRLMSTSLTERAVVERRKTVTRRVGWLFLKPGDRLTLCRKVMGRRRADGTVEPLVRLAEVEVVDVRRESLDLIDRYDVSREGFPLQTPSWFVRFFCATHRGCTPATTVTRIEWRYLDDDCGRCGGSGLVSLSGRGSDGPEPCPDCGPPPAEGKLVDLMAALENSVREAKEARARHRAAAPAPEGAQP